MSKIQLNSISDTYLNWGCFDFCGSDFETKFQALITKACTEIAWNEVALGKLVTPEGKTLDNPIDILNVITKALQDVKDQVGTSAGASGSDNDIDVAKISLCGKDTYNPATYNECLAIVNDCYNRPTLEALIQALVKRTISYAFWLNQQNAQIQHLTSLFNSQQAQLTLLSNKISNCCP
jgi:hypothetical protein